MRSLLILSAAAVQLASSRPCVADLLYVSSQESSEILRFDSDTGAFVDVFVPAGSGGLDEPAGLTFGPDGNLYVAQRGGDLVLRYDGMTGAFIDVFVPFLFFIPGTSLQTGTPTAIAFGPDGHLYLSTGSVTGANLVRFDGSTGAFFDHLVSMPPSVPSFGDFEFGPDGDVYCTSRAGGVYRFDGATFAFIEIFVPDVAPGPFPPPEPPYSATGIEFGFDGRLYVFDWGGEFIKRFDGTTGDSGARCGSSRGSPPGPPPPGGFAPGTPRYASACSGQASRGSPEGGAPRPPFTPPPPDDLFHLGTLDRSRPAPSTRACYLTPCPPKRGSLILIATTQPSPPPYREEAGCVDSVSHEGAHSGGGCSLSLQWTVAGADGECDEFMGNCLQNRSCEVDASLHLISCCAASGSHQCGTNPPTNFGPITSCGSSTLIVFHEDVPIPCGDTVVCTASATTSSPFEYDFRKITYSCSDCSF